MPRGLLIRGGEVVTVERRWRADVQVAPKYRGALGAAVAVADGVAYVCTHHGTVAAFKASERLWAHRYASGAPGFAYNDPVVVGDRLIVAPSDATHVTALDVATGKPVWTWKPPPLKGSVAYIAGVTDDAVVLAGREVVAIGLQTGKPLWKPVALRGMVYGRGFVGEKWVHLSTRRETAAIERIDVATGARGSTLRFDVKRLGNLLSLDGRLFAAGEDELMCFTTLERESARPASAVDRAFVAAQIETGDRRERALRHLEAARVNVVYKERVERSDKVARALRAND